MDALLHQAANLRRKANRECRSTGLAFASGPTRFETLRNEPGKWAQLCREALSGETQSTESPSTNLRHSENDRRVLPVGTLVVHQGQQLGAYLRVPQPKQTTVETQNLWRHRQRHSSRCRIRRSCCNL